MNDILRAISLAIRQEMPNVLTFGVINSVSPTEVRVLVVGSASAQRVYYDTSLTLVVGQHVVLARPSGMDRWVILGQFNTVRGGLPAKTGSLELSPPSNLRSVSGVPGSILMYWDAPPASPVVFEVQTSATGTDADVVSVFLTRGSLYILKSDGPTYVRVRSIDARFHLSSWTSFVLGTPDPMPSLGDFTDPVRGQIIVYDGAVWKNISPLVDGNGNLMTLDDELVWID